MTKAEKKRWDKAVKCFEDSRKRDQLKRIERNKEAENERLNK